MTLLSSIKLLRLNEPRNGSIWLSCIDSWITVVIDWRDNTSLNAVGSGGRGKRCYGSFSD